MENRQETSNSIQEKWFTLINKPWRGIAFIFILTLVVFFPALLAGFIWDDTAVTNNPLLRTLDGLWKIWFVPQANFHELHYWPIVYTLFWFEQHLWGNNAFGYHLLNILLHALNAVLLWNILQKMELKGAWFASLIFALHPVHVESVAWIIERKDVLSTSFYLASFLCYLIFLDKKFRQFYFLSLLLFIGAMLSKSMAISLPIAILLYVWWKTGKVTKSALVPLVPFFGIALILTGIDIRLVHQHSSLANLALTSLDKIIIAGKSVWFYLWKLILPVNLMTVYPRWNFDSSAISQYGYFISFLIGLIVLYFGRKKVGRGPLTAFLFFFITLAPTLGFIEFSFMYHSFVADRFLYLPSIGLLILFGSFAATVYHRVKTDYQPLLRIAGLLLLAVYTFLTWKQSELYYNDEKLFSHNIALNSNAWLAYNNLGLALAEKNKYEDAFLCYQKAITLNPEFVYPYNNLGNLFLEEMNPKEAEHYFSLAINKKPEYAEAHNNLGIALAQQGRLPEAITQFQQAVQLNPFDLRPKHNLEKALQEINVKK